MAAVEISLDRGSRHTFAPGDRVTGKVTYTVKTGTKQIWDVRVTFVGSIETRIFSSDTPRSLRVSDWQGVAEKQPIFRSEQRLVQGAFTAKPQKHTYNFEFEIPKNYSPTKPDDLATTLITPYIQQPLPLSLHTGRRSRESSAKIEYKLHASVVLAQGSRTERAELPIIVGSSTLPSIPKQQTFRFKFPLATWNSFRAANTKLSLRQRLSQIAHHGSPSIALDGGLHIPEELSTTQFINVRFSANQIRTKASDPVYPHLRLKRASLTLYGFTEVVCWYSDHPKGPQSIRHMHKDEIATRTYIDVGAHDGTIIRLDGSPENIASNWRLADFAPADLVPDFTSALTLHRHSLVASIELFHEESSHIMKLNVEVPIKVLPQCKTEPIETMPEKTIAPLRSSTSTPAFNIIAPQPTSAVQGHLRAPSQAPSQVSLHSSRSSSTVHTIPRKQISQIPVQRPSSTINALPRKQMSMQPMRPTSTVNVMSRKHTSQLQRSLPSANDEIMLRQQVAQLPGSYMYAGSEFGISPVQSPVQSRFPRPQSAYTSSDPRYSLDSGFSTGTRHSPELPIYSSAIDPNHYYSNANKGNPPAYRELQEDNIPPQNELPPILRVMSPPPM